MPIRNGEPINRALNGIRLAHGNFYSLNSLMFVAFRSCGNFNLGERENEVNAASGVFFCQ